MILLAFLFIAIGYIMVYLVILAMWIAFLLGTAISFMAYTVSYLMVYAKEWKTYRRTPEWQYQRNTFEPNTDKIQSQALTFGAATGGLLTFAFIIHAFVITWPATLWVTGIVGAIAAFFTWDNAQGPKRFNKGPTIGDIQDRHKVS